MAFTFEDVQSWRALAAELRHGLKDVQTASGKATLLDEAERLERKAAEVEKDLLGGKVSSTELQ